MGRKGSEMKKTFTLEYVVNEDDTAKMDSKVDGFNPFELIGILQYKINDIELQMRGKIVPDIITRTLVK